METKNKKPKKCKIERHPQKSDSLTTEPENNRSLMRKKRWWAKKDERVGDKSLMDWPRGGEIRNDFG